MTPPPTPHTDDPNVAVLIERVDNLRSDVTDLRRVIEAQTTGYVSRGEFDAWRAGIGREVADLKARRAPWWAAVAAVAAVAALLVSVIPALAAR